MVSVYHQNWIYSEVSGVFSLLILSSLYVLAGLVYFSIKQKTVARVSVVISAKKRSRKESPVKVLIRDKLKCQNQWKVPACLKIVLQYWLIRSMIPWLPKKIRRPEKSRYPNQLHRTTTRGHIGITWKMKINNDKNEPFILQSADLLPICQPLIYTWWIIVLSGALQWLIIITRVYESLITRCII